MKQENRKYQRLCGNLAVDFTIVRLQGELLGIDWQQGCVTNVSKGGICIETKHLNESMINYLVREDVNLELRIKVGLNQKPVRVIGEVAWYKQNELDPGCFIIGLKFKTIAAKDLASILKLTVVSRMLSVSAILWAAFIFLSLIIFNTIRYTSL